MRPEETPGEADVPSPLDPLTDLFFTVAAVVLATLAVLVPSLQMARTASAPPERVAARLREAPAILVEGRPAALVVADRTGLRLDGLAVPLDRIPDDAALARALAALARGGQPLVVAVEPDGQESGFLLDGAAARAGIRAVSQLRLDHLCGVARSPAGSALCRPGDTP